MRALVMALGLAGSACGGVAWSGSAEEPIPLVAIENRADLWTKLRRPDNGEPYWLQTHIDAGDRLCFSVPDGATEIRAKVAGGAPFTQPYRHAGLPAVAPELTVDCADGSAVASDSSAEIVEYDSEHVLGARLGVEGSACVACLVGESGEYSAASVFSLLYLGAAR